MKTALCLVLALFVVADSMPVNLNPGSQLSLTKRYIKSAENDLTHMDHEESQELSEMAEVGANILNIPDHQIGNEADEQRQVFEAAQAMDNDMNQPIMQEKKQQAHATDALAQVNYAIHTIENQGATTLGEQQAPTLGDQNVKEALSKLSQVEKALAVGTKTSNTMHKIEHMRKEAEQLMQQSSDQGGKGVIQGPVLGDPEPSAMAALSHPASQVDDPEPSPTDDKEVDDPDPSPTDDKEATQATWSTQPNDESALAALSHPASQVAASAATNDMMIETQELQHILTEEKQVASGEKAGLHEVHELLHKLG